MQIITLDMDYMNNPEIQKIYTSNSLSQLLCNFHTQKVIRISLLLT